MHPTPPAVGWSARSVPNRLSSVRSAVRPRSALRRARLGTEAINGRRRTPNRQPPPRAWSTYHYSIVLLTEFAQKWTLTAGAEKAALDLVLAPAISPAGAVIERANLLEAIEFRPNVLTEALAQKDSFIAYFRGALSFSKATHPSTFFLVHAAVRIAEKAAALAALAGADAADRGARPCILSERTLYPVTPRRKDPE
jgi:hypothetical protein